MGRYFSSVIRPAGAQGCRSSIIWQLKKDDRRLWDSISIPLTGLFGNKQPRLKPQVASEAESVKTSKLKEAMEGKT